MTKMLWLTSSASHDRVKPDYLLTIAANDQCFVVYWGCVGSLVVPLTAQEGGWLWRPLSNNQEKWQRIPGVLVLMTRVHKLTTAHLFKCFKSMRLFVHLPIRWITMLAPYTKATGVDNWWVPVGTQTEGGRSH